MKRATIADAPAVLNTNDKAMWVLGFNAAVDAQRPQMGVPTLANVIDCLRSEGRYVDEEGEATDRLQDLLDALSTAGVQACDRLQCGCPSGYCGRELGLPTPRNAGVDVPGEGKHG